MEGKSGAIAEVVMPLGRRVFVISRRQTVAGVERRAKRDRECRNFSSSLLRASGISSLGRGGWLDLPFSGT